jgi:hypothetical protein
MEQEASVRNELAQTRKTFSVGSTSNPGTTGAGLRGWQQLVAHAVTARTYAAGLQARRPDAAEIRA